MSKVMMAAWEPDPVATSIAQMPASAASGVPAVTAILGRCCIRPSQRRLPWGRDRFGRRADHQPDLSPGRDAWLRGLKPMITNLRSLAAAAWAGDRLRERNHGNSRRGKR